MSVLSRRKRAAVLGGVVVSALGFGSFFAAANAAELLTAEVTAIPNEVTVTQGTTTSSTISLSAAGNMAATQSAPAYAQVKTSYSLDATGNLTASSLSLQYPFWGTPAHGSAWLGSPAPYGVTASFSADANTPVGDYTVVLSKAAGTTVETNPNSTGAKLTDDTSTLVVVHVVAPVVTNHNPTVQTAAADANGNEGDTLTTSGSFTDQDGNALSLSAAGAGSFHDNGDGTWSWSLATTDDTSGSVTVTANDGHGGTATDSFDYTAVNVAPTTPGTPTVPAGTSPTRTGSYTVSWTASTDVPADSISYTLQHRNASGVWSTVASGITTTSHAVTEAEGTWQYRVLATDGEATNGSSDYSAASASVVVDKSAPPAPTLTPATPDYVDGAGNAWFKGHASATVTPNGDPDLADGSAGSGVDSSSFSSPVTGNNEGHNVLSAHVSDNAGNQSADANVDAYVDNTAPVVSTSSLTDGATLVQGSSATVHWSATDGTGSGVSGAASGDVAVPTSAIGAHTVTVPAVSDHVGNSSAEITLHYTVVFNWNGFFQPIDNNKVNSAKAGQSIPVKFSLGGNQGLNILAGTPSVVSGNTTGDTGVDAIEDYTTSVPGLTYDSSAGQYVYVWKTDKSWVGSTKTLQVVLIDGTVHKAVFTFTK